MTTPILARADSGKTIGMRVGNTFAVRLEESPTTGFVWAVTEKGDNLALLDSDYSPAAANAIGGGGMHTFQFLVRGPGATTLRLSLRREWEGEASAIDSFSIDVSAT